MQELELAMADGKGKVWLARPEGRPRGGVILYMDAFGPRASLRGMAERMAGWGYLVALPDLFYRFGPYGPFDAATAFSDPEKRAQLMGMIQGTSQDQTVADTAVVLGLLEGPVATVGYCMGGARAMNAASAHAGRIVAAASFHGGNLASDAPDSPHRRLSNRVRVHVASAGEDRSFPPEQSARLAQALREAGVDHMIENYPGCAHGWCVPDHAVYDAKGSERHFRRLETLFAETLTTG